MPNYDINYDDKRFTKVETDKNNALSDIEETYSGIIEQSDGYFQKQIDAADRWEEEQKKLQQEKTDFAIEKIEQQKAQAEKDYKKEQSGAYVDWQKQSNQYGANAEAMAAQGMAKTGYAESSQVSMYNTYQNRVATAREAFTLAVINYDNAIKDAQLQNSSILAEIAYETLQKQLELSLQGFQYKNQLVLELADKKREVENTYYSRYQDVLKQINTENALAEEVRQHNATLAHQQAQLAEDKRQFDILHPQTTGVKIIKPSGGSPTSKTKTLQSPRVRQESKANDITATFYINELIKSGASKDKVSNEIALALRNGAISKETATELRNKFTPRGIQY